MWLPWAVRSAEGIEHKSAGGFVDAQSGGIFVSDERRADAASQAGHVATENEFVTRFEETRSPLVACSQARPSEALTGILAWMDAGLYWLRCQPMGRVAVA